MSPFCSDLLGRDASRPDAACADFAHQIIEVAERQDDPTYRLVAYRMLATNQFYAGHNRLALDSLLRASNTAIRRVSAR